MWKKDRVGKLIGLLFIRSGEEAHRSLSKRRIGARAVDITLGRLDKPGGRFKDTLQ